MRLELTCPRCGTAFYLEDATDVTVAICPSCDTPITLKRGTLPPRTPSDLRPPPVPAPVLPAGPAFPPTAPLLRPKIEPPQSRGGQWMVWIAVGFGALWVLVIVIGLMFMLMRSRPAPVATAPPPKPITAPAPKPAAPSIFSEAPSPTPTPPAPAPTSTSAPAKKPEPKIVEGPPPLRLIPKNASISDEEVGEAIRKGVDYLLANFDDNYIKTEFANEDVMRSGQNALALYALLVSSQAIRDGRIAPGSAFMKRAIERMKSDPMRATATAGAPVVYARALRASALAVYKRPEDMKQLRDDVAWLRAAAFEGAYTYDDYFKRPVATPAGQPQRFRDPPFKIYNRDAGAFVWDNSNSQYGLLGVWAGADATVESMDWYWKDVEKHWIDSQLPDGRWFYRAGFPPSHNMTTAGIASLFVTHDQLDMIAGDNAERHEYAPALAKALQWYESGDNSVTLDGNSIPGYGLYGVERVGLASGLKFFGTHDWYRELGTQYLKRQMDNGAFVAKTGADSIINTSYLLLFLSRGRHPVLMTKLRYDGTWNYRPRDLANLTKYASAALERPMNGEVVDLKRKWMEWMDSPIVYLAGSEPPEMSDDMYENLRLYVENGGLLFTHADNGSKAFNDFAEKLATKISPYEMRDLSPDDPLYTLQFPTKPPHPPLRFVTNGSRILMIHSPTDITSGWVARNKETREQASQLALNIHTYATGKAELRNRIESTYLAAPMDPPTRTITMARIRYGGNWDPEPAAWPRFSRYMQWETGWKIDVQPTPAQELDTNTFQLAHLTGSTRDLPSDTDIVHIRKYVQEGGVLLVDICGGSTDFYTAFNDKWLPAIFPGVEAQPLDPTDPLLTGKLDRMAPSASDVSKPRLRPYAVEKIGNTGMRIRSFDFGKGRVIYSTIDLTTGLLGTNTWGILGFTPEWSQAFCKNVVLWAVKNREEHPTTTTAQ